MKVVLAFPPQAVPFLPHQAPAQLVAVLKSRGISAMQKDYNLEAYEYFLSSGRLKQFGISPMMAEQVEEEKSNLRNGKDFFVPDKYFQSIAVLQNYLGNISGQYPGCRFSFKDFEIAGYDTEKSRDIIQASGDEKRNPFIDFFKEKIEELKQLEPQILGISIAWKSQLVPGFTLARLVKKYLPHTHICMGGSMISHLSDLLKTRVELFEYTDSFIPFDGEIGLAELAENIEGKNFSKVSGLIYKHKGKIISNPVSIPTNLNLLPLPDFSGLELDKYYSPKVYLPVNLSRGCYWSGCQFCTHHLSASSFRIKNPVTMLEEMNSLNNRYGCSNFYFVDDAFPPEQGKVLAELIRKNEKSYRWAGEFRMEKMMDEDYFHTLHDGGCRLALFGLESYCDRILNKMNKGWDTSRVKNILASAHNAGIKTWVFFFLGFPGERRFEAKKTLEFIKNNTHIIDLIAGGDFVLTRNSPVYSYPEKFSVTDLKTDPDRDLQLSFEYETSEGASEFQRETLLRKFRNDPRISKYMFSFVSEPHILFFPGELFL